MPRGSDRIAPFSNTGGGGLTTKSVAHLYASQRLTSQAFTVTPNQAVRTR